MGATDFDLYAVKERLQKQIDTLRRQVAAQEKQITEQGRQIHEIQTYLTRREALELDAHHAQSHIQKYLGQIVAQLNARATHLTRPYENSMSS